MIKKITSIILALSLALITIPQVMANSVTSTLVDITDFYQLPGTTSSDDRNYSWYIYPRHGHTGHAVANSAIADKAAGDSYLQIIAKAPNATETTPSQDTWICFNTTGDGTDVQKVNINNYEVPVIFSFDVFHRNRLDYIFASVSDTANGTAEENVLGAKIYSTDLSDDKFDTITIVYIPKQDGSVVTESYINGKFHSTKVNLSGVDQVRLAMDSKSGSENLSIPFDNFKIVSVDEFISPQLTNATYIQNGEVINFYEMTAAELKAAFATPGLEFSVVDAEGELVADTANLFTGMKLISKTTSLGAQYQIAYPLASGQSYVEKAIAQVSIPTETTSNLTLSTQIGGASISWSSNVPGIISNTGVVTQPPASDILVTLTAVYTDRFKTETVEYEVVVESRGETSSVSEVNVILSSHNAEPGKTISYDVKQVDDYGSWDVGYSVTSTDEEIIIDAANKTISSIAPGVYKVTFTCAARGFETSEIVAFGIDGDHHIYSSTNSSNPDDLIVAAPTSSMPTSQSDAFGPILSDYVLEADMNVTSTLTQKVNNVDAEMPTYNFTIRMRDTNTDALTREGYNFSFMDSVYLSITNPSVIGTSATGDYEKIKSVFGLSRGHGATVHTWNFASTKQVTEVDDPSIQKGFNKAYHVVCTIIEDTMSAKIYDGGALISTQVVKLSDLDRGKDRITQGYTRLITENSGGTLENIVLSTPSRWINSIKIELDDPTLSPTENVTDYIVYGKSSGGEWIELTDTEYTLTVSDDTALSVAGGQIIVNNDGVYSVGVNAGNLSHAVTLSRDADSDDKDAIDAQLVIDNADGIRGSFTLPAVTGGNKIIWASSDPAYITVPTGEISPTTTPVLASVTRPVAGVGDKTVTLTATVYCTGFIVQKTIPVTVIAEVDEQAILNAAVQVVSIPTSTTSNITLPTVVGDEGVAVTWTSSNTRIISNVGTVTRGVSDNNITLTAVYSVGSSTKTVNYVVNVPGTGSGQQGGTSSTNNKAPAYVNPGATTPVPSNPAPVDPQPSETASGAFADVKSDAWYYDSVKEAYELGLVNGVSANEFHPERSVNREEFIKILCNAAGIENTGSSDFEDVSNDSWYAPFVNAAVNAGIVSGISDSEFGVGLEISRQDMCVMIYKALLNRGVTFETVAIEEFADSVNIADYAKESIYALKSAGLVNGKGDNLFAPTGKTTRAEATTIILRMMDMIENA